jgi:basic membrane lipoprotein Med (substrate-binding protein (PBP1-ABC) superfamily)
MAALPQILSWSAMEQFHKLSQGSKTVLSEMKRVDVAVYNYLKTVADGFCPSWHQHLHPAKWRRWPGPLP